MASKDEWTRTGEDFDIKADVERRRKLREAILAQQQENQDDDDQEEGQ